MVHFTVSKLIFVLEIIFKNLRTFTTNLSGQKSDDVQLLAEHYLESWIMLSHVPSPKNKGSGLNACSDAT